jgi:DNA-binding transcriptional MerR regulator
MRKFLKNDPLSKGNLPEVPRYGTGQVAEILNMKMWRLQKFLNSPRFRLSASGQLGQGQGSRRLFTKEDVCRIGVAAFLTRDGFTPKLVSEVLQRLEDRDLIDFDEDMHEIYWGISLRRGKDGPEIGTFPASIPPDINVAGPVYYAIDFGQIIDQINRRMAALAKSSEV